MITLSGFYCNAKTKTNEYELVTPSLTSVEVERMKVSVFRHKKTSFFQLRVGKERTKVTGVGFTTRTSQFWTQRVERAEMSTLYRWPS